MPPYFDIELSLQTENNDKKGNLRMKPTPSIYRMYDLAAMRGWRTIRLDRIAAPKAQQGRSFSMPLHELPKAV